MSLQQAYGTFPTVPGPKPLEENGQFSRGERDSPSGNFRNFVQRPGLPVKDFKVETALFEQQFEGSQERRTPSLSHSVSQKSSASSNDLHASDKASCSPVEEGNSALQPITNPGTRKRGRGRPRLFPPATGADHPIAASTARQTYLERNRKSAEKCRQKKKDCIATVVAEASSVSSRNKVLKEEVAVLREQVLDLKNELLRHAGCQSRTIDKYIAQSADNQFTLRKAVGSEKDSSQTEGSIVSTSRTGSFAVPSMADSSPSQQTSISSVALDEYVSLWMLDNSDTFTEQ
ncbi:hypothetical protein SLS60_002525 [Paraconiothyrium brasiliense]|uniref:BZIP domain-containing protein n=1 Tax=Paraconiothyrium brasiliense TaxID=300254 RepID=A0ABR3S2D0_9PLEO